jgi:hypothetical protein
VSATNCWYPYDIRQWHNQPPLHQERAMTNTNTATLPALGPSDEEKKRLAMLAEVKRTVLGPKRSRWNT